MSLLGQVYVAGLLIHVVMSVITHVRAAKHARTSSGTLMYAPVWPFVLVFWTVVQARNLVAVLSATSQSVLFLVACYLGFQYGVLSRELVSPVGIGLGLVAGHAIFGLSLLATHQSVKDVGEHLLDVRGVWAFVVENPQVLLQFVSVSIGEEMIYRVAGQPLAIAALGGNAVVGIVVVALAFSFVHEHFFRNEFSQSAEFLVFSLTLGILYYVTGSLILVIVIHAVRNIEIAMLEHAVRVEETGGEDEAETTEDLLTGRGLLVMVDCPACVGETACFSYSSDRVSGMMLHHQMENS